MVVGNAVPPLFACRIFESVIAKLKETDGRSAKEYIKID